MVLCFHPHVTRLLDGLSCQPQAALTPFSFLLLISCGLENWLTGLFEL